MLTKSAAIHDHAVQNCESLDGFPHDVRLQREARFTELRRSWRTAVIVGVLFTVAAAALAWNQAPAEPLHEDDWIPATVMPSRDQAPTIVSPSDDWMSNPISDSEGDEADGTELVHDAVDPAGHHPSLLPPPLPHEMTDVGTLRR